LHPKGAIGRSSLVAFPFSSLAPLGTSSIFLFFLHQDLLYLNNNLLTKNNFFLNPGKVLNNFIIIKKNSNPRLKSWVAKHPRFLLLTVLTVLRIICDK